MALTRSAPLVRRKPLKPTPWPRAAAVSDGASTLQRRTPLQATPWQRGKGVPLALPETPTKRHPRPAGPDILTVQRVLIRDDGRCVVCGRVLVGERGWDWSVHHRRGRDGKADSHSMPNLILVCGGDNQAGCHGRIHQQRSWAEPNGFWLSRVRSADPLLEPIRIHGYPQPVWLTADGISETPPTQDGGA